MSASTDQFAATDRQRLRLLRDLGLEVKCFFDVGASNGWWSRLVGEDFPDSRFEMFEPLSDHSPDYQESMAGVLRQGSRFRLHKVAVGSENKRVPMHIFPGDFGSTALDLREHRQSGVRDVEVEMLTLDDAVQRLGLPVPEVVKVDTQGCELDVLQGAQGILPKVSVLVLETWMERGYGSACPLFIELALWLRDRNFYPWDFGDTYRSDKGVLVTLDWVFLNTHCEFSRLRKEPKRQPPAGIGTPLPVAPPSLGQRLRNLFR